MIDAQSAVYRIYRPTHDRCVSLNHYFVPKSWKRVSLLCGNVTLPRLVPLRGSCITKTDLHTTIKRNRKLKSNSYSFDWTSARTVVPIFIGSRVIILRNILQLGLAIRFERETEREFWAPTSPKSSTAYIEHACQENPSLPRISFHRPFARLCLLDSILTEFQL